MLPAIETYLVEVDHRLPELLVGLVEISHSDLTEVTGVVLVKVGAVVVLTTGHTATTGMLAVLADTTVTGLHMTAAGRRNTLVRPVHIYHFISPLFLVIVVVVVIIVVLVVLVAIIVSSQSIANFPKIGNIRRDGSVVDCFKGNGLKGHKGKGRLTAFLSSRNG